MEQRCSVCGETIIALEASSEYYCDTCRPEIGPHLDGEGGVKKICIVGMGYVGTSLAAVLAEQDLAIHGIDIDPTLVDTITAGKCPIGEQRISDVFEDRVDTGDISVASSFEGIADCGTIIVTVGTPLATDDPDLSAVKRASHEVGQHLAVGDLVIYRSTLPAGATEDTIRPILEAESGLDAGTDFSLAFCPERMAEGNAYDDLTTLPVVVGGYTDRCREATEAFWQSINHETVSVSSPRAAELTKLADNWWIDLNIALANELALLAEELGVNADEVISAANTLPKGDHHVNILNPGAGVGGSCLVKDPVFVATLGEKYDLDLQTPRISRQINEMMPSHMVELVKQGLGGFDGQTIAVLGYAYKAGTDDTRHTPATDIIETLEQHDLSIRVTDPYVPEDVVREETGYPTHPLPSALHGADALVIVTGHEQYRDVSVKELISFVGDEEFAVIDGRHVFEPRDFAHTQIRYVGVGCGSDE